MRKFFSVFGSFLLVVILVAISGAFNYTVIDVRLGDLNATLKKAAEAQDENKSLGMLARYELIRRRMERGRETSDDYELESKVQAILASGWEREERVSLRQKAFSKPARFVVSAVRLLMGKKIQKEEKDLSEEKIIEVAYFWERNRNYDKATKIYEELIERKSVPDNLRRYILLHQGFCFSMVSRYDEAKTSYEKVIKSYPESEAAVVAWKLIDFVDDINKRLTVIRKQGLSNLEEGKKMYLLMDYRGAIKNFSRTLQQEMHPAQEAEVRFMKGRSHEELGEIKEALVEYRRTIKLMPQSSWAREANRRIYILGEFYQRDREMTKTAIKRIQEYRDANFFGKLQELSGMIEESDRDRRMRKAIVKERRLAAKGEGITAEQIEAMLREIDLTGEEAARKRKSELEAKQGVLGTQLADAKARELEKEIPADHPFRSPSAIKNTVRKYLDQLEYIYQRNLRRGKPFEGKMTVKIYVEPWGDVSNVEIVSSNTGNPGFEKQVLARIKKWRFLPVPDDVGVLKVNYPLEFRKKE